MKFWEKVIINTILLGLIILFVVSALSFPPQARTLPLFVGIPALFLMSIEYINQIILKKDTKSEEGGKVNLDWKLKKEIIIVLWLIGLVGITYLFGFNIAIPLFLFSFLKFYFSQSVKNSLIIAFSVWVILYISFEKLLKISLNCGVIFK